MSLGAALGILLANQVGALVALLVYLQIGELVLAAVLNNSGSLALARLTPYLPGNAGDVAIYDFPARALVGPGVRGPAGRGAGGRDGPAPVVGRAVGAGRVGRAGRGDRLDGRRPPRRHLTSRLRNPAHSAIPDIPS